MNAMKPGWFFFVPGLTDRSSGSARHTLLPGLSRQHNAFSPGNFFADYLDRTVIYQKEVTR
ncbi:MAG: hypothetical protein HY018_13210 [Hydrogenophilales bacterium]|nr:hypothetical protein [Hydrogenophilales bacterium]